MKPCWLQPHRGATDELPDMQASMSEHAHASMDAAAESSVAVVTKVNVNVDEGEGVNGGGKSGDDGGSRSSLSRRRAIVTRYIDRCRKASPQLLQLQTEMPEALACGGGLSRNACDGM